MQFDPIIKTAEIEVNTAHFMSEPCLKIKYIRNNGLPSWENGEIAFEDHTAFPTEMIDDVIAALQTLRGKIALDEPEPDKWDHVESRSYEVKQSHKVDENELNDHAVGVDDPHPYSANKGPTLFGVDGLAETGVNRIYWKAGGLDIVMVGLNADGSKWMGRNG